MVSFFKVVFILFLAVLDHCCGSFFSSCGEQRLLSSCGAQAYCCDFSCCRVWALGMRALAVVAPRL